MSHCCSSKQTVAKPPYKGNLFLSREDAEDLWNTLQSNKTDTKVIVNILGNRTLEQRLEIIDEYQKLHQQDLIEDLKKKLSGDLKNLIVAMMMPLNELYATELHRAIDGWGTNESILIEVLCTLNNRHIKAIKRFYKELYNVNLEDDVKDDTSGNFKDLLVALIKTERNEHSPLDVDAAAADVEALQNTTKDNLWQTYSDILIHRSFAQLRLIFEKYESSTGNTIESAIKDNFGGDVEDALLAIVGSVTDSASYFATKLRQSMEGLGTRDDDLVRLVVSRSEIDMEDIKKDYEEKYAETLKHAIKDDTSGDYQTCLLLLIGEEA